MGISNIVRSQSSSKAGNVFMYGIRDHDNACSTIYIYQIIKSKKLKETHLMSGRSASAICNFDHILMKKIISYCDMIWTYTTSTLWANFSNRIQVSLDLV